MQRNYLASASTKRRTFLKELCAGTLAAITLPAFGKFSDKGIHPLPLKSAEERRDEQYWEMVKKQFTVSPKLTMVNAANLCPSPYFIQEQVVALTKSIGRDVSFQYRDAFAEKRKEALLSLATFLSVSKDELTITRNTSEGNSFIVNGLDFKAGDEIILWDQNHPTNGISWEQRARRYGFAIKKVTVPPFPKSVEELITPFVDAITSKTRLIGFSQISNTSGIALPAKQLCMMARDKGILTLVDGAQSFGVLDFNLKDLGCDFYTASTHKWLMGPLENGILYVNQDKIERLWPTAIGAGWKATSTNVDEKLSTLGQRNETATPALIDILEFHTQLGKNNIEARVRRLTAYMKEKIQVHIPQAKFISPLDSNLSAGI
jgi:isopenicillin-N epimerase